MFQSLCPEASFWECDHCQPLASSQSALRALPTIWIPTGTDGGEPRPHENRLLSEPLSGLQTINYFSNIH